MRGPRNSSGETHPPHPRLTLNVGITGHRATGLPDGIIALLEPVLAAIFGNLARSLNHLLEDPATPFASEAPVLRLHTPLASGADQLAAKSARKAGFEVRALLPFAPSTYRQDFTQGAERAEFERHLGQAGSVFSLPCNAQDKETGYVMVGKAVIAVSDVLVAIWDGEKANGPGGTGHVVELALKAGVPVIHVDIGRDPTAIERVALLGTPLGEGIDGDEDYDRLARWLLDPLTPDARAELDQFYAETEKRANWRIEYPLMLAMLGIRKIRRSDRRQASIDDDIAYEFGEASIPADPQLSRTYGWTNFLAIRYAQMFRSGHVLNYALSAIAVLLALAGLLAPDIKLWLVVAELVAIALLVLNTRAGNLGQWHRRWLQYRHLAETLRPLSLLKQTGMAPPPFRRHIRRGETARREESDWTRWYATAIWRAMASPEGLVDMSRLEALGQAAIKEQLAPQASYHRALAHRMHLLDHRLHQVGGTLMGAVIVACGAFICLYLVDQDMARNSTGPFIVLTAGLPAVGAAIFGLRGHGEHLLAASRSRATADALEASIAGIENADGLETLSRQIEHAAEVMLADLDEWTMSYRERSLEIPA